MNLYNIDILSKCDDENIRVAIVSAVMEMMTGESDFYVSKMKRGKLESPVWNAVLRGREGEK